MASFSKIILVTVLTLPVLASCGKADTPTDTVQSQSGGVDKAALDQSSTKIEAVKDLKELAAINASIMQDPKKDAPKFVEYQKKQMLLGVAAARMRTPEYLELEKQRLTIVEYRDKWSKELQDAEAKVQTLLATQKSGPSEELSKAINDRMLLIQAYQATPEYQSHIKANQEKLNTIIKQMEKFTTPEVQKLQAEVIALRKEVYGK